MTTYSNQTHSSLEDQTKIERLSDAIYSLRMVTAELMSLKHLIAYGNLPQPEPERPKKQQKRDPILALLEKGPEYIEAEIEQMRCLIESITTALFS